jgi:predicted transglutaminase-like cysteine proteinase
MSARTLHPHAPSPKGTRQSALRQASPLFATILGAALLSIGISVSAPPAWANGRTYPPLFGAGERMFSGSVIFPKWSGMLQRLARQEAIDVAPCRREQGLDICEIDKWKAFIETQRGRPVMEVLDAVNRYLNAYPYVLDAANYGVEDYWATPQEDLTNGGDCEDYAIAKYVTLRKLGFASEDLRVVVLNDLDLKVQHAILAVYIGNRAYVLDNQTARVQAADRIVHYQPIYSVTEGAWWLHVVTVQSAQAQVPR